MKFIIYKANGGLAHMCKTLSQVIVIAKKLNRHLIIDCEVHSAFKNKFSRYFTINDKTLSYSCNYDKIPQTYKYHSLSIDELKNTPIKCTKNGYYLKNIKIFFNKSDINNNIIVLAGVNTKTIYHHGIKVNKSINMKIEKLKIKKKYISIHFRNTDIKNNINNLIKNIKLSIYKYKIKTIYLATDDYFAYEKIKNNIKNINIIQYTKPENFNGKNIHYSTSDKNKLIYNCLLDMYMIFSSDFFIPSKNSGLSKWIIGMIKNKYNIFSICSKTIILP